MKFDADIIVEIIRCIIHGGKETGIQSLAIVGAAAGSGASTKEIMTIGSSTVVAAASLLCFNTRELHRGPVVDQVDNYVRTFGRRDRYILHQVVSVLSYLVFGMLPLVAYCFILPTKEEWAKALMAAAMTYPWMLLIWIGKMIMEKPARPYLQVIFVIVLSVVLSGWIYLVEVFQPLLKD